MSLAERTMRLYKDNMVVNTNVNSMVAHGTSILAGAAAAAIVTGPELFTRGVFYGVDIAAYYGVFVAGHYLANRKKFESRKEFGNNTLGCGLAMIPAVAAFYGGSWLLLNMLGDWSQMAKFTTAGIGGMLASRAVHTGVCVKFGVFDRSTYLNEEESPTS